MRKLMLQSILDMLEGKSGTYILADLLPHDLLEVARFIDSFSEEPDVDCSELLRAIEKKLGLEVDAQH